MISNHSLILLIVCISLQTLCPDEESITQIAATEASNFRFGRQLGFGEQLTKKQLLRPKLAMVRARGASRKIWDILLIFTATLSCLNSFIWLEVNYKVITSHLAYSLLSDIAFLRFLQFFCYHTLYADRECSSRSVFDRMCEIKRAK